MKKFLKYAVGPAIAALVFAASAFAQPFVMRISSSVTGETQNEWMRLFKAGVEKRSAGRLRVELYEAGRLGQLPATVEGVALGTIEMAIPATGYLVGLEPRFQIFDAPGLFENMAHGQRSIDDAAMRKRIAGFGANKGVETLFVYVASPMMMLTRQPTRTLADLKGQKIRVQGGSPLYTDPLRRFAANPIPMPLGEVTAALQNRTLDGTTAGLVPFVTFKYIDISRELTEVPGTFLMSAGIVNRDFLKSIGPELEAVVREESRKAEAVFYNWGPDNLERMAQRWRAEGGNINLLSKAEQGRYSEAASVVGRQVLAADPKVKDDYEALLDSAARQRH